MKKLIITITFFSLILVCNSSLYSFSVGEKLTYEIHANGIYVGKQKMHIKGIETVNGRKCYHIVADTEIDPEIAKQYNYYLHDVIHTWVDVEHYLPVRIKKHVREGEWKNLITSDFYYKIKRIWYYNKKKCPHGKYIKFKSKIFDILSLVAHLRTREFKFGKLYKIEYIGNDKPKVTTLKYTRGPELEDGVKTIMIKQVGKAEARSIKIVMTDDERRIPVKANLEFDIKYFSGYLTLKITGILVDYKPGKDD